MRTAIVSDLHLGTTSGSDVARLPEVGERLCEQLHDADRVVALGDLLELRERPAAEVLRRATSTLAAIGAATAGRELVIVPGNHDHALVAPGLERMRLAGRSLTAATEVGVTDGELAGAVAELMPGTDVRFSYPGFWVRDDVYATHGHYLDLLLTVPRLECLAASAAARLSGHDGARRESADFEDGLAPLYAFAQAVAQSGSTRSVTRGGHLSRRVWTTANGEAGGRRAGLAGEALTKLVLPSAVATLNALGLGPFRADISPLELRRSGLRAMAGVVTALGIDARYVVFGHTHRAGPLRDDVEGWWLPGGAQLTNTGSWLLEPIFTADGDTSGPYWPGRVTVVDDDNPPEPVRTLDGMDLLALLG